MTCAMNPLPPSAAFRISAMPDENWCSELDRMFAGKVRLALWERLWERYGNRRDERTLDY